MQGCGLGSAQQLQLGWLQSCLSAHCIPCLGSLFPAGAMPSQKFKVRGGKFGFHHLSGAGCSEVGQPCPGEGTPWDHSSMCCQGTVLGTGAGLGGGLDRGAQTAFAGHRPSLGQVPAEGAEVVPRPQNPLELLDLAFPGFECCW